LSLQIYSSGVGVTVEMGAGVDVGSGVQVLVGTWVAVGGGVAVGIGVAVQVDVGVGVSVAVGVGVGVSVGVGVGVGTCKFNRQITSVEVFRELSNCSLRETTPASISSRSQVYILSVCLTGTVSSFKGSHCTGFSPMP
jgi:hypothetical protein